MIDLHSTLPKRLLMIVDDIRAAGGTPFLVGGWVRDAMLGTPSRDFDVEVYGIEQDALLEVLSKHGKPNLVGKFYGVINLYTKGMLFDFSFPRLESKTGVGHRAFDVETRPDLDFRTASMRRDFTINAMGLELPMLTLVDPHNGCADLEARLLRHVGPAFAEDPLRVLRAVQFAARFELSMHPQTIALCKTLDMHELSKERLYEELRKWLMKSKRPSIGLTAFVQIELYKFFPAICPLNNDWNALGKLLDRVVETTVDLEEETQLQVRLAALCAGTQSLNILVNFLESLTTESAILQKVPAIWKEVKLVKLALQNGDAYKIPWLKRSSLRAHLPAVVALAQAEVFSDDLRLLAQEHGFWTSPPEPFLAGKTLLTLGLKPGPKFGKLIKESFELQLDGILTTEQEANEWAKQQLAEQ